MSFVYTTASLLYRAVKQALVPFCELNVGDFIIVTGATDDIVGVIDNLQNIDNNQIEIMLSTASGIKLIKVSANNCIHLIKRANMLNLRDHTDYERDLKNMAKDTHGHDKDGTKFPEHSPVTDSDKSALPTSKISLNLQQKKSTRVQNTPILNRLMEEGSIHMDNGQYIGTASDGANVILGHISLKDQVEHYLVDHPFPLDW